MYLRYADMHTHLLLPGLVRCDMPRGCADKGSRGGERCLLLRRVSMYSFTGRSNNPLKYGLDNRTRLSISRCVCLVQRGVNISCTFNGGK